MQCHAYILDPSGWVFLKKYPNTADAIAHAETVWRLGMEIKVVEVLDGVEIIVAHYIPKGASK